MEFQPSLPVPAPLPFATTAVASCNTWPPTSHQTLFTPAQLPINRNALSGGLKAVGASMAFTIAGTVQAIRFFRASSEAGTGHTARIYDASGTIVATAAGFNDTDCTGAGWVVAPLTRPLRVSPNVDYTVVVDNLLYFAVSDNFFAAAVTRGNVLGRAGGGRFGPAGTLPIAAAANRNYWVDGTTHFSELLSLYVTNVLPRQPPTLLPLVAGL